MAGIRKSFVSRILPCCVMPISSCQLRDLHRALLTAVLTVAVSELVKVVSRKYRLLSSGEDNSAEQNNHAGHESTVPVPLSLSADPERGRRWYTYQTW